MRKDNLIIFINNVIQYCRSRLIHFYRKENLYLSYKIFTHNFIFTHNLIFKQIIKIKKI